MSSTEKKSEDKPEEGITNSGLQAEDCSIKNKCIESVEETNGTIGHKSDGNEPEVHVDEAETDTVPTEQKAIQLSEKTSVTQIDKKAEEPNSADETKQSPNEQKVGSADKAEKSPQKIEKTPPESVASEMDDSQKADSDKGKEEIETAEKNDQPAEQKSADECDGKNDNAKTAAVQGGLPKWMVQDANAPPSPSPEVDGHKEKQQPSDSPLKVRGRGRGRRPAAEKTAALQEKAAQSAMEETASQRPRRSTRSRIDYANPDAVTVLAEVDDEEPSGTAKRQKGSRVSSNKPGQDKGLKRKTVGTSEDEVRGEEDEDDLDYGAKKKKKRVGAGSPSKRGRPAGSKSKTTPKAKSVGRPKRGRNNEKESEDDDAEIVYDDRVSEKERTTDDEFEETKSSPTKVKNSVQAKPPAKKRGRPPGRRQGQQNSIDNGKTAKNETDEAKADEESGTQQTINVEA